MIVIALLTLDIHIPHAHSLKDKRMILRSLKDRLRTKFNVSVSEVDHHDLWQRSQISVVTVGSEERFLQKVLQEAITLTVFMVFAYLALGERLQLRYGVSFALIFAAVLVAFQ